MRESGLRLIDGCHVTDSSGCHRYDYWNEQAIFDGRSDTGWCTPSRTEGRPEYLEIDLAGTRRPLLIRLQARPIEDHPGFPRAIRVLANRSGDWVTVLDEKDLTTKAGQWWQGKLEPVSTDRVRLEFDEVGWRPNGCYYLQFMQLQMLEEVAR